MKKKIAIRKKSARITLRLDQEIKDKWVDYCQRNGNQLNNFITNTVEGKLTSCERRQVMKAIDGRYDDFHRIGININQIAKVSNSFNDFPKDQFDRYNFLIRELNVLMLEHREYLRKIYKQLAKD